jgi:hypothetical protein
MFSANAFDSKVIDDKAEGDGTGGMAEEAGSVCSAGEKTFQGGNKYGMIDAGHWNEVAKWLLAEESSQGTKDNFGLDTDVAVAALLKLLAGNEC